MCKEPSAMKYCDICVLTLKLRIRITANLTEVECGSNWNTILFLGPLGVYRWEIFICVLQYNQRIFNCLLSQPLFLELRYWFEITFSARFGESPNPPTSGSHLYISVCTLLYHPPLLLLWLSRVRKPSVAALLSEKVFAKSEICWIFLQFLFVSILPFLILCTFVANSSMLQFMYHIPYTIYYIYNHYLPTSKSHLCISVLCWTTLLLWEDDNHVFLHNFHLSIHPSLNGWYDENISPCSNGQSTE